MIGLRKSVRFFLLLLLKCMRWIWFVGRHNFAFDFILALHSTTPIVILCVFCAFFCCCCCCCFHQVRRKVACASMKHDLRQIHSLTDLHLCGTLKDKGAIAFIVLTHSIPSNMWFWFFLLFFGGLSISFPSFLRSHPPLRCKWKDRERKIRNRLSNYNRNAETIRGTHKITE